jgi:hypothetical protein
MDQTSVMRKLFMGACFSMRLLSVSGVLFDRRFHDAVVVRTYEIPDWVRDSFENDPRDLSLSTHAFTWALDKDPVMAEMYSHDFGISHGRLWVKVSAPAQMVA